MPTTTDTWEGWARRLAALRDRARGPRREALRQECLRQLASWYRASRQSGKAPEDEPGLAALLRGRLAE